MIRKSRHSLIFRTCALVALSVPALIAAPARADIVHSRGAITVTPGGRVTQTGFSTAVVSATATNGDAAAANSALLAANVALNLVPGYIAVPARDVKAAFGSIHLRDTLDAKDYQEIGKKLKASRVLTVTVTPGAADAAGASCSALVEVYDTASGGLVGRGQADYTATADSVTADNAAPAKTATNTGKMEDALSNRALSNAVYRAAGELSRAGTFTGIVVSIPGAYQARLSIGEHSGLRNGARVEYLANGEPIAFGTVVDLGSGDAVATVAPESNVTAVGVNTVFRTVSNPTADRKGKSDDELTEAGFKNFANQFGLASAIAGIVYYAFIN